MTARLRLLTMIRRYRSVEAQRADRQRRRRRAALTIRMFGV